ncbi:MAG: hypothetical protein IPN34_25535 [Planctomycetes bacterium]|nr:hypothetical protein [Planctomycetota bacterium]
MSGSRERERSETGGSDPRSGGSSGGDEKGAERAKSKREERSFGALAPPWARLLERWSERDPRAEQAKERRTEARAPSSREAADRPAEGVAETEPVLLLRYLELAPEQIARASAALKARGFVSSGAGDPADLDSFALGIRSVAAARSAPSIFVGWIETTSAATPPSAPVRYFAAIAGGEPQVAQHWVQLGELERAIATAAQVEELARHGLADSEPTSRGAAAANESVASKDDNANERADAAKEQGPLPGLRSGDPGLRGEGSLSRGDRRSGDAELRALEAKKEAPGSAGPDGSAAPATGRDRAEGAVEERGPTAVPGRPGSPDPSPSRSPSPSRAVRVLAILEPKRGG